MECCCSQVLGWDMAGSNRCGRRRTVPVWSAVAANITVLGWDMAGSDRCGRRRTVPIWSAVAANITVLGWDMVWKA